MLFGIILFSGLLLLAIIDFRKMILPDILTLPLVGFGLLSGFFQDSLTSSIIGAIIGYTVLLVIEIIYKNLRKIDGIGRGDAKLLAAGGAWCGWYGLPFIILIASASGLAHAFLLSRKYKKNNIKLPFGPHLALGIFIVWFVLHYLQA